MLRVRLLGELEVDGERGPVAAPAARRAWALLAWLALHPGEHPRSAVAARFWPDVLDTSARASLRSAAWALRRSLGPDGDALVATRDRVGLRGTTDLGDFDALVAAGDLEAAVALCRGPLLADLDDDWVLEARDEHAARLGAVLAQLAATAPTPAAAVGHARRRLGLDPLDEAAARDLMARLADAGDRAGALAVYDRLADRLRAQLGLAPSAETRAAAATLRDGDASDPSSEAGAPEAQVRPARTAAAGAHPADGHPWTSPLVGREAELAVLLDAWATAAGTLAVLTGDPGIGKTRLAREVLARAAAEGARTAACASLELGGAAPLGLWAELLRELARTLRAPAAAATWPEELATVAPSLPLRLGRAPAALPSPAPPELARARLFEASVDAVEHACADRPLALLFEDVHLADAPSLELLAYVLRRAAGLPVLAVLTRRAMPERPDFDALLHAQRSRGAPLAEIDLGPLPDAAVEVLVRSTAAGLSAPARAQVVAGAEGNPLLAVESARATARGSDPAQPPPSLRAAVHAAIGRLPPDARRTAELAAVAGRDLAPAELAALTTPEAVLAALDAGLFAADHGRFGFRHALLREAAVARLPDARRRVLHEELAGVLSGPAAEVARHLRLAGRDDLAADRLAGAAADALVVGAVAEAEAFLAEALELRPGDPRLMLELAHAHAWRGRPDEAEALLADGLEVLGPERHEERAEAHVRAAKWYSGALCRPRRTTGQAHLALGELEQLADPRPELLGSALALGAWGEAIEGHLDRARPLLDRLRALRLDDADIAHDAANAEAFVLLREDRLADAVARFRAAAHLAGAAPDRAFVVWVNAACVSAALERFEDALADVERGLRLSCMLPPLAAPLYAVRATILLRLGRVDEAREALAQERRAAERSGTEALLALADHDEGMALAVAGDYERAAALLARALDRDAQVSRPLARLARAEALARLERADEAESELRAVTAEPVAPGDRPQVLVARLTHVQGLVARARGDGPLAARRLEEAESAWARSGAAGAAGEYLANLVDLGRPTVGVVQPARELQRVREDLRDLTPVPT